MLVAVEIYHYRPTVSAAMSDSRLAAVAECAKMRGRPPTKFKGSDRSIYHVFRQFKNPKTSCRSSTIELQSDVIYSRCMVEHVFIGFSEKRRIIPHFETGVWTEKQNPLTAFHVPFTRRKSLRRVVV
jgi:hypothetical protein